VLSSGEVRAEKFKIYPNPSAGMLSFYSDQSMVSGSLRVFSGQGQLVYELRDISHLNHTIQIDLPSGNYFCRLYTNESVVTETLLIIR
jgi:hypothetical protein